MDPVRDPGTGTQGRPGSVPGLPRLGAGPGPAAHLPPSGLRRLEHPPAARSIRDVTSGDIPTLALSGAFDAQTGADNGPYVARTLSNAKVVTIPYEPHVVFATSKCAQDIAVSFFDTPAAPKTECLNGLEPPEFEIGP